jgi:hypothetical protein
MIKINVNMILLIRIYIYILLIKLSLKIYKCLGKDEIIKQLLYADSKALDDETMPSFHPLLPDDTDNHEV